MPKWSLLLLMGGLSAALAAAGELQLQYAYGAPIHSESGGPVFQLPLTQAVYHGVYYPDLRDLSVVNAAGQEVPFLVRDTGAEAEASAQEYTLPFFPLRLANPEALKQIRVSTHADGAIINIDQQGQAGKGDGLLYYIVDASAIDKGEAMQLRLQWQPAESAQLIEVPLEASDDLQHWSSVTTLVYSQMSFAGYQLQKDTAELEGGVHKYYRLAWGPGQAAALKAVTLTVHTRTVQAPPAETQTLQGTQAGDNTYSFDAQAYLPVARINLLPAEDNSVAEVRFYSRNAADEQWQPRGTSIIYRLHLGDRLLQNDPIPVPAIAARYWQVEVIGKKNYLNQVPQLQLQWQPQQLLFLAQGPGPYQLLYGRSQQQQAATDTVVQELLRVSQQQQGNGLQPARLGPQQLLCGAPCLQAVATPISWTRYVLWLVILLGVGGLTWMSVVLYREMNKPQA